MTNRDVIANNLAGASPNIRQKRADRILAALVDADRVIVPVEPTRLMVLAGLAANGQTDTLLDIYRAMTAAAPQETDDG